MEDKPELKVVKNLIRQRLAELLEEAKNYDNVEDKRWILELYKTNKLFLEKLESGREET